jgi:hypothetical protein
VKGREESFIVFHSKGVVLTLWHHLKISYYKLIRKSFAQPLFDEIRRQIERGNKGEYGSYCVHLVFDRILHLQHFFLSNDKKEN